MGSVYSSNLRILAGKLETVPGTAETTADLKAAFDVAIRNPEVKINIPPDEENSKFSTGDHGEDAAIMGAQSGTIGFDINMCMGASAIIEPKWWKFAKACGCKEKTYTTFGIALQPIKDYDDKTMTIGVWDIQQGATPAAILYKFAGCMGTMTFGADGIGKPWKAKFSFQGKLVEITDILNADIPVLGSYDTALAEKMLSNTATLGGVAQCFSQFNMDTGNTINPFICQSEASGYKYFAIGERRPRFSFNPLVKPESTENIHDAITNSTSKTVSIASTNFTLKVPVTQLMAPNIAIREGYVAWEHTLRCLRNGTTDVNIAPEAPWELLLGARA
jgi:hypothetical protein